MERIVQEDVTGCGLACVAMIAGVTYEEVRKDAIEYFDYALRGPFYTCAVDLRAMLWDYDYTLSKRIRFKSFERVGPLCVLGIERGGSGEEDHWVLLVKCGLDMFVFDPSLHVKTVKRRDWSRLKVVSYMNVRRL